MGSFLDIPSYFSGIIKPLDPKEFRRQGHMVIDFLVDYYQTIKTFPVRSQVYLWKRLPQSALYDAEPLENILHDVKKDIIPVITHWQSPNYFAYFPSSGSTAGFVGETLSTGFNVVGFNWLNGQPPSSRASSWIGLGDCLICGNRHPNES